MITNFERLKSQASLAVMVGISLVVTFVTITVSEVTYNQYRDQRSSLNEASSFMLADSGLELALLSLRRDSSYSSQNITFPEGSANINVSPSGGNVQVTSTTIYENVRRSINATVSLGDQINPLSEFAAFGGDDVVLVKTNSELVGNLWTNDNVDLDESTTVVGNVYAAGLGNASNSAVRNGARVIDNPATPEIEGNIFAIDRIRIVNNGYVQGVATSASSIQISSGGVAEGGTVIDPNLSIATIQVPTFDFDTYKTQAQTAGTYFSTAAQFANFLQTNGNIIDTGGVYYIDSGNLTLSQANSYIINANIISNGAITIRGQSYVHTAPNNLPALAAKQNITVDDQTNCSCTADIIGIIYSNRNVVLKHDQYTGSQTHAVNVTGAIWAGDKVNVEDYSRLVHDADIVNNILGFNFGASGGGGGGGSSSNNSLEVINWNIN